MFKFASLQVLTAPTSLFAHTILLSKNQFNGFIHFIPKKARIIFFQYCNCCHNTQAEPLAGKKNAEIPSIKSCFTQGRKRTDSFCLPFSSGIVIPIFICFWKKKRSGIGKAENFTSQHLNLDSLELYHHISQEQKPSSSLPTFHIEYPAVPPAEADVIQRNLGPVLRHPRFEARFKHTKNAHLSIDESLVLQQQSALQSHSHYFPCRASLACGQTLNNS